MFGLHFGERFAYACVTVGPQIADFETPWMETMSRNCLLYSVALIFATIFASPACAQQNYRHTTENFVVYAPDPAFARKIGSEAERFRRELAIQWIGDELPTWSEKCPIQVRLAAHSGGETSFAFMFNGTQRGEPTGWDMKIFGTPERLLDSVLPHEVTHTIFATHFRRPLPRWADEGACTTVEHQAEKKKNHGMLIHFLTSQPSRGIPFNRMFTMRDYPQDILPLYAQGFSVAKYLIMEKGRRHFLDYVNAGMEMEQPGRELEAWNAATRRYYGFRNLSDLQVKWERWVADGSQEKEIPNNDRFAIASVPETQVLSKQAPRRVESRPYERVAATPDRSSQQTLASLNEGWYAKQMKVGRSYRPKDSANESSQPQSQAGTVWR